MDYVLNLSLYNSRCRVKTKPSHSATLSKSVIMLPSINLRNNFSSRTLMTPSTSSASSSQPSSLVARKKQLRYTSSSLLPTRVCSNFMPTICITEESFKKPLSILAPSRTITRSNFFWLKHISELLAMNSQQKLCWDSLRILTYWKRRERSTLSI